MGGGDLEIRRIDEEVDLQRLRVARGKGVALHLVEEVGRRALNGEERLALHAQLRQRRKQRPGIGVAGIVEDLLAGAHLDDAARVHHGDAVGHVGHHAQIVGDVDGGEVVLLLHLLDEFQNLRLNGHVQRRGRFIADEYLRTAGHGDGDDHPLAHAAGKLVGVLAVAALRLVDAHVLEHFQHGALGLGPAQALMQLHGLLDLLADGL